MQSRYPWFNQAQQTHSTDGWYRWPSLGLTHEKSQPNVWKLWIQRLIRAELVMGPVSQIEEDLTAEISQSNGIHHGDGSLVPSLQMFFFPQNRVNVNNKWRKIASYVRVMFLPLTTVQSTTVHPLFEDVNTRWSVLIISLYKWPYFIQSTVYCDTSVYKRLHPILILIKLLAPCWQR